MVTKLQSEKAIVRLLAMEGASHPLLPFAVKILVESFQTGEPSLTSSLDPTVSMLVDPGANLAAILGSLARGEEPRAITPGQRVLKRKRKKTDYDKRMKRALTEVNAKARLKNGSFRKGWDQAKVMKKAHKLARKYGPSTKKGQVRKTARRAYRK